MVHFKDIQQYPCIQQFLNLVFSSQFQVVSRIKTVQMKRGVLIKVGHRHRFSHHWYEWCGSLCHLNITLPSGLEAFLSKAVTTTHQLQQGWSQGLVVKTHLMVVCWNAFEALEGKATESLKNGWPIFKPSMAIIKISNGVDIRTTVYPLTAYYKKVQKDGSRHLVSTWKVCGVTRLKFFHFHIKWLKPPNNLCGILFWKF